MSLTLRTFRDTPITPFPTRKEVFYLQHSLYFLSAIIAVQAHHLRMCLIVQDIN